jgi:acetyl-CoA C-acetyltransferase
VLIGVGTATHSAPVHELLVSAAAAAGVDCGVPALLSKVQRIGLPQGTWTLVNPGRMVARRIGAPAARTYCYEIGVSQQEVINDALRAIAEGEVEVALVLGGEDRAWVRHHDGAPPIGEPAGGGDHDDDADSGSDALDVVVHRPPDFVAPIELAAGMVVPPVQQYALIENALAHHEGTPRAAHLDEVAKLWARCNEVAQRNPLAAFPSRRTAADIATPGSGNRPLAFPYNKWHASQWTVDQAAALLFCATGYARAQGVPPDRWLFPHVALHVTAAVTLAARRHLHAWPAMGVLGDAAAAHLGTPFNELPIVDLYSCFPAAVRVQQRCLDLPLDSTPTVTGGMAFAGGPFNNYVLQATAAVAGRLRDEPKARGLVTTVNGMLHKPGLAVWSATPPQSGWLLDDLTAAALAATPTRPVAEPFDSAGPARVASFTVGYEGSVPVRTMVIADLDDGRRTAATCDDPQTARDALREGCIGQKVHVQGTTFSL